MMGETFIVNSLEEMCDMMCNNIVPRKKKHSRGDEMKIERMIGTMIGLAVGDALGVPVEFQSKEKIRDKYGVLDKMVGGGTWGQPAGTVSDDTDMALAVAEGIVKNGNNPIPAIGENFIRWYQGHPFDVGACCSGVISDAIHKGAKSKRDWHISAQDYDYYTEGNSGGNGGLMRTAFVGCYYRNEHDVEKYAMDICGMTHWNDVARTDCALVSLIIHRLIDGGNKEDIEQLMTEYADCKVRYNPGIIEGYPFKVEPTGFGVNSLKCALKCVLSTNDFKSAVVMAVNMGGDTDTIGAITGAIAGALYGIDDIPDEWVSCLDKNVVKRLANVVSEAAIYRMGW